MDEDSVQVKKEFDDGSSKKRRRTVESVALPAPSGLRASYAAAAATASSSSAAAAAAVSAASLLPDALSLDGIHLLMDLFGESLQPFLTSALSSFSARVDDPQSQQPRGPNTFRISKNAGKNNTINLATAFV
jgi:methyl coenzyme M reductase alpha subunit